MTDSVRSLAVPLPCPFCGLIPETLTDTNDNSPAVRHHNPLCPAGVGVAEHLVRWNRRAAAPPAGVSPSLSTFIRRAQIIRAMPTTSESEAGVGQALMHLVDDLAALAPAGVSPSRDELAKVIQHNLDLDGHYLSQDTNEVCPPCARLADAILARWPAPAGVSEESHA